MIRSGIFRNLFDQSGASQLVTDFNPIRLIRIWKRDIAKKIDIPFYEVDAHNLIPCCYISRKIEYAAYTLRPKVKKYMDEYMDSFPEIVPFKNSNLSLNKITNWDECISSLKINLDVKPVNWLKPGAIEAGKTLNDFLSAKISNYAAGRNDPNLQFLSNLSPYLHFGQISAQRVALETLKLSSKYPESVESFIEELIVRRELADNFCYYNPKYDSFDGFHDWAKLTLNQHRTG